MAAGKAGGEAAVQRRQMQADLLSLSNTPGRSLSSGERRLVFCLLFSLQLHDGKNLTDAIEAAAKWFLSSDNTIRAVWYHWQQHRSFEPPEQEPRGGGSERHPNHYSGFTHADTATLQLPLELSAAQRKGEDCSSSHLVNELQSVSDKSTVDSYSMNMSGNYTNTASLERS
jgi:hypothetical protein